MRDPVHVNDPSTRFVHDEAMGAEVSTAYLAQKARRDSLRLILPI
jgi:hypothetical protein